MGRWIFRTILGKSWKAQERVWYQRRSVEAKYRGEEFPLDIWRERSHVDVQDVEYAGSSVQYASRTIEGNSILSAAHDISASSTALSSGAGSSAANF